MLRKIISFRRVIQGLIGFGIYMLVTYFNISLLYVIIAGSALGLLFGKVFCRWMCPMGFIMELLTGGGKGAEATSMYQYHKLGCPIAWVSGFFNRFSFINIKRDTSSCNSCGICDKSCYISSLNDEYSLFKEDKKDSGKAYSCSKCLECVKSCPQYSLTYSFLPVKNIKKD